MKGSTNIQPAEKTRERGSERREGGEHGREGKVRMRV